MSIRTECSKKFECFSKQTIFVKVEKVIRTFQLKMKVVNFIIVSVLILGIEVCVEEKWRGHMIKCCRNGSAVKVRGGKWVWSNRPASLCGPSDVLLTETSGGLSVWSFLIIFGAAACVACQCCFGCFWWNMYRQAGQN